MSQLFRASLLTALLLLAIGVSSSADFDATAVPSKVKPGVPSQKKAMWGPAQVNGVSQFPIYRELGVGIWQTQVNWASVAPTRPADPLDPADPAYRWPEEVDYAITQGRRHGIRVLVLLTGAPSWANGGHEHWSWAPKRPRDFAAFATAASRRWPRVTHWMVWGEPSRENNFKPFVKETRGKLLNAKQRATPRRYARILDTTYGALKALQPSDLVIGGNTFTTGEISPRNWVRFMKLPDGRAPRMDLYGHNPFTGRKPNLKKPPLPAGFSDFSDLDTLWVWLDRWQTRGRRKPLRVFVSEYTWQTDRTGYEFNFYISRTTAAAWLRESLKIVRASSRIYSLGWLTLYDEPPQSDKVELRYGLIDAEGRRKPGFSAYVEG